MYEHRNRYKETDNQLTGRVATSTERNKYLRAFDGLRGTPASDSTSCYDGNVPTRVRPVGI